MQAERATQHQTSEIVPSVESTYRVTLLAHSEGGGLEAHFYHVRAIHTEDALFEALAQHYAEGGSHTLMTRVERTTVG